MLSFFISSVLLLARCAQFFLSFLVAPGLSLCASHDINDDLAVIFAARRACPVAKPLCAAIACDGTSSSKRMMTSALTCLGAVYPHSYNHGGQYSSGSAKIQAVLHSRNRMVFSISLGLKKNLCRTLPCEMTKARQIVSSLGAPECHILYASRIRTLGIVPTFLPYAYPA